MNNQAAIDEQAQQTSTDPPTVEFELLGVITLLGKQVPIYIATGQLYKDPKLDEGLRDRKSVV